MLRTLCSIVVAILMAAPAFAEEAIKHRVLIGGKELEIVDKDGNTEWKYDKRVGLHDLHMLPSGNILTHSGTKIIEIDPKSNKVVWEYDAKASNADGKPVEVHAIQRLADGNTMIAESGRARIIEVDPQGKLVKQVKLKADKPSTHSDTRLVRKIANGNYLVAHENDGFVREYDDKGTVVWEYEVPLFGRPENLKSHGPDGHGNRIFGVIRLPNGNTLIGGGNGNFVAEVTPDKKVVWDIQQKDLPGITLAWVTTLQYRPNGNIIFGNCHATEANPSIIEVTRDKKVVWTFNDFKRTGDNMSNSQVLDVEPETIR
jgi:outer membrane protein assembly factor BamB